MAAPSAWAASLVHPAPTAISTAVHAVGTLIGSGATGNATSLCVRSGRPKEVAEAQPLVDLMQEPV